LHLIDYIARITKFQKEPATDPAGKEANGNLSKKEAKGVVPHNPIYCCWWSHAQKSQKAMHVSEDGGGPDSAPICRSKSPKQNKRNKVWVPQQQHFLPL
jgi:hypothetical protein